MRRVYLFLLLLGACVGACRTGRTDAGRDAVDSLNERAFSFHYRNIDSVRALASEAYERALLSGYIDGMAEALNNQMFERFQQMDFDSVVVLGQRLQELAPCELELLVCDIMQMKVDQRTSDNRSFFTHRSHALRRLQHIERRRKHLSAHAQRRLDYACGDLHIVGSTYFYYVDQRERALEEIRQAEPYCTLNTDTAQWLYYCYMRGSGGLAESTRPEDVTLEEFDYLLQCFTLARYGDYVFFEANSSQSLATMFADSLQRACLDDHRGVAATTSSGIPRP